MSNGVIAVLYVVVAAILVETVLPRVFAVCRSYWRRNHPAKTPLTEECAESAPETAIKEPDEVMRAADVVAPSPLAESTLIGSAPPTACEQESSGGGNQVEADRLWKEARAMPHSFIPDAEKDGDYFAKIHAAANLGHLKAMAKLGEYAFRRGAVVEAYYWTALAELKGAKGLGDTLRRQKTYWLANGCPPQYSNVYEGFSEQQGSFARALLRIRSAVDSPIARARMKELAQQGCWEAQLFLGR